jgi:excisionase family DNA binding protein
MGVQPEASMAQQLLTVAEVAAQLRVSTMTIYRLIRSGELPAVRVGRNYRVRADELELYLQAQVVDPATLDVGSLADEDLHRDAGS